MSDLEHPGSEREPEIIREAFRPAADFMPALPPEELRPMKSIEDFMPASPPEELRSMKSIGDFMAFGGKGALKLVLTSSARPELGKAFEMANPIPMSSTPVMPPPPGVRGAQKVSIVLGATPESLAARQKLASIQTRIHQHPPGSVPSEGKEAKETSLSDPKPPISIERLVFLERVEKIMASEARIKEIEAENKTLIGMVTRLQKELDELKVKHSGKL